MRNLYIIRHAKTNPFSDDGNDFSRNLLPKGISQAKLLTEFLNGYPFEHRIEAFVSTANRTLQTWYLIQSAMEQTCDKVHHDQKLYHANLKLLLAQIWNSDTNSDLMFIGHNPGLCDLANYFVGDFYELKTSGFVHIRFHCKHWSETSASMGELLHHYHPKTNLFH